MTFEIAISTMHKTKNQILEMVKNNNIKCNCLVINQCDLDDYTEIEESNQKIRIIFTTERGLSKSRNMAIKNIHADIFLIADDDLFYYDNFEKKIIDYYTNNTDADIVLFNIDSYRKKFKQANHRCRFLELGHFISVQMTVKKKSLRNIMFNEYFGTGSGIYDSGEENIFLADCYKAGLKIFYSSEKILRHDETESTWFKGYNNSKYISDRGPIYYQIWGIFSFLLIVRFAFTKRKKLKPISFMQAVKLMNKSKADYKKYLEGK